MAAFIVPPGEKGFVAKSWGWERWLVNTPDYCGKLLTVARGRRCSYHSHKEKEETFLLQSGSVTIELMRDEDARSLCEDYNLSLTEVLHRFPGHKVLLEPGDTCHVPPGVYHRFTAHIDSVLVEFSTHHEDSDSYRVIPGSFNE